MKMNQKGSTDIIAIVLIVLSIAIGGYTAFAVLSADEDTVTSKDSTAGSDATSSDSSKEATFDDSGAPTDEVADTSVITHINAAHTQLEARYSSVGSYPSEEEVSDSSWWTSNASGISSDSLEYITDTDNGAFSYKAQPAGCSECTGYKMSVTQSTGTEYSKVNLN